MPVAAAHLDANDGRRKVKRGDAKSRCTTRSVLVSTLRSSRSPAVARAPSRRPRCSCIMCGGSLVASCGGVSLAARRSPAVGAVRGARTSSTVTVTVTVQTPQVLESDCAMDVKTAGARRTTTRLGPAQTARRAVDAPPGPQVGAATPQSRPQADRRLAIQGSTLRRAGSVCHYGDGSWAGAGARRPRDVRRLSSV